MSPKLPETREEIQIELAKQESLLAQIHAEMNAGFASKKREEQLWEVQRIITQLKRKLRTFERKQDSTQKSMEDTIDGEACTDSHIPPKAKSSCSDDESIKTVTILSTESATNTETKSTPQDIYPDVPSTVCEENPSEISENISPSLDDTSVTSTSKNPEKFYISESGLLMLPESHPERLTLIRLQLENQELTNWKCQLQARINAERADLLRLKKLTQATENEEPPPPTIPPPPPPSAGVGAGGADESDYERIIEHYVRENTLLEQKRDMLAKEIFEENQELIQMKVELALRQYKI